MNSWGRVFRVSLAGESHGPGVSVLLDGVPAGIALSVDDFREALRRRQGGHLPGTTKRQEEDLPEFGAGVFNGYTTGSPLLLSFPHHDVRSTSYADVRRLPRPGHADLVAEQRFGGFQDYRGGGHFSGRLTVGLVAAGVVAGKISELVPRAEVISVGGSTDIEGTVRKALSEQDSVGGVVECRCAGVPAGIGEPFFDSVESQLAHLAFAIPAVKGVEFGAGFQAAAMRGAEHNDVFTDVVGHTATNHAGGISGGLANGNELVWRVAVKPTASISREQTTIDRSTGETAPLVVTGRHDACIALRVPPILEAVTAIALTDALMLARGIGQR